MLVFRNGTTIFIQDNGSVITSDKFSKKEFKKLLKLKNPNKIRKALKVSYPDDLLIKQAKASKKFVVNSDGSVFRKGINLSLPRVLLEEFLNADKKRFKALNNFWKRCCLMIDPECRDDLFAFVQRNGLQITDKGFLVSYRNVDTYQEGNKKLHDFIVKNHLIVTNVWKKNSDDFFVIEKNGGYTITTKITKNIIGTLSHCYNNLFELTNTVYTDNYSKKFRIKIGEEVRIDRFLCDANKKKCHSRGLHQGSLDFLNNGYFGNTALMCLVDPRDVVAVPDSGSKFRCCAYFPINIVEYDENGKIIPFPLDVIEDIYTDICIANLNHELSEMDLAEHRVHRLSTSIIEELRSEALPEMIDVIKKRVVYV